MSSKGSFLRRYTYDTNHPEWITDELINEITFLQSQSHGHRSGVCVSHTTSRRHSCRLYLITAAPSLLISLI